jgi:Loader and inhibitor of phage G40P
MTKGETAKLVAVIAGSYPTRIRADQVENMIAAWAAMLADLDYTHAEKAVATLVQSGQHPPSVADVRARVVELTRGRVLTGGEAWGTVQRAMRREGAYRVPGVDFTFSNPTTARCVGIMDWQTLCLSEDQVADRARFIQLFDQLATEERREQAVPMLAQARGRSAVTAGGAIANVLRLVQPPKEPERG